MLMEYKVVRILRNGKRYLVRNGSKQYFDTKAKATEALEADMRYNKIPISLGSLGTLEEEQHDEYDIVGYEIHSRLVEEWEEVSKVRVEQDAVLVKDLYQD